MITLLIWAYKPVSESDTMTLNYYCDDFCLGTIFTTVKQEVKYAYRCGDDTSWTLTETQLAAVAELCPINLYTPLPSQIAYPAQTTYPAHTASS